jgi:hypothetical protein
MHCLWQTPTAAMWFLSHILTRFEMIESDSVNFWQWNWGISHSSHPLEASVSFANGTKMQRIQAICLFIRHGQMIRTVVAIEIDGNDGSASGSLKMCSLFA